MADKSQWHGRLPLPPDTHAYLSSHFGPQHLPHLVIALAARYSGNLACLLRRCPNFCMLVTNMRLYGRNVIEREDRGIRGWEARGAGEGGTGVVEWVELGYGVFRVYDYRLGDLRLFIEVVRQLAAQGQWRTGDRRGLEAVAEDLGKLATLLMAKMQAVKAGLQIVVGACMQMQAGQTIRKGKQYFNMKLHAKIINQKLKQVQQRYTEVAAELIEQSNKLKQQARPSPQPKQQTPKNSLSRQSSDSQDLNAQIPADTNTVLSYLQNRQSHRSILKTSNNNVIAKLIEAKDRSKNKRTSIDLITDMAQRGVKESRFRHRQGINIGSGRTIQKNGGSVIKKKARKQVKIDQDSVEEASQKQRGSRLKNGSHSRQLHTLKTDNESKAKMPTKGTQTKGFNSNGSLIKFYSDDQLYKARIGSYSCASIASSRSVSRKSDKTSKSKSENKISSGYSFLSKKKRSSSKKKSNNMSTSLNNIIMEALQKKNGRKRGSSKSKKTEGSEINIESGNSQQGWKLERNIKKVRANYLDKDKNNKYAAMLSQLVSDSIEMQTLKPKQPRPKDSEGEIKSARRIGIKMHNDKQNQPNHEQKLSSQSKQPKTTSQLTSNGSRRINISNPRIRTEQYPIPTKRGRDDTQPPLQQYIHAPQHAKVDPVAQRDLLGDWVRFYPDIECSLYKIAKKHAKQQECQQLDPNGTGMTLQYVPTTNRPGIALSRQVTAGSYEHGLQEAEAKRGMFGREGLGLMFSRQLASRYNQLQQKEMDWLGQQQVITAREPRWDQDTNTSVAMH